MDKNSLIQFFLQISLMLGVVLAFGRIAKSLHQPAVLGEIIGGIILGPIVFGLIFPDAGRWIFPSSGPAFIAGDALIKFGMLFFLFVAGLEVEFGYIRKHGRSVAGLYKAADGYRSFEK